MSGAPVLLGIAAVISALAGLIVSVATAIKSLRGGGEDLAATVIERLLEKEDPSGHTDA